jgi:hypothetical protein
MIVVDGATATLLEGAGIELGTVAGTLTLDESRAPYAVATVTIAKPAAATLDLLDPRGTVPRISLELTASYPGAFTPDKARTFDLGLRRRFRDLGDGSVQLSLSSDESLLDDDRLLDDEPLSMHAYQGSIRALVNAVLARIGAALQPGPDVSIRTYNDATNLITNPGMETAGAPGWAAFGCNIDGNDLSWAAYDARSMNLWGGTLVDSFADLDGGLGGMRSGLQAGRRYLLRVDANTKVAYTGAADANARRASVYYRRGAGPYQSFHTNAAPNVVGSPATLTTVFELPADTTEAWVRLHLGSTTGQIRFDAFRLSEYTGDPTDTEPFNGSTAASAGYAYAWEAGAHASRSRRTALIDRPADSLLWAPGRSALDFLAPILQAAGMRLFCTEAREWFLVDGATYTAAGVVQLTQPGNLHRATETTDRDSGEWFDAALVRYRWRRPDGTTAERIDFHGAPGYSRVETFELDAPYPGPGRAAYKVKRAAGVGRTADVAALTSLETRPTQVLRLTLEDSPQLLGVVRAVTFDLGDGTMQLASRGLTDLGPDSILAIPDEYTIAELPGTINALTPSSL